MIRISVSLPLKVNQPLTSLPLYNDYFSEFTNADHAVVELQLPVNLGIYSKHTCELA